MGHYCARCENTADVYLKYFVSKHESGSIVTLLLTYLEHYCYFGRAKIYLFKSVMSQNAFEEIKISTACNPYLNVMALSENGFKGEKAERIAVLKPLPATVERTVPEQRSGYEM